MNDQDGPIYRCGTCDSVTDNSAIGCDRCDVWFDGTPMCLGLPQNVVDAIKSHNGQGIAFICTTCRATNSGGTGNGSEAVSVLAFGQLHETVKALCRTVESLVTHVKKEPTGSGMTSGFSYDNSEFRDAIREEAREIEERRIRKCSIIIKGTSATSAEDLKTAFKLVSTALIGRDDIDVQDIFCLNENDHIYRAKITDQSIRQEILNRANLLKDIHELKDIYLSKDLTFKQRKTLQERRLREREQNLGTTGGQMFRGRGRLFHGRGQMSGGRGQMFRGRGQMFGGRGQMSIGSGSVVGGHQHVGQVPGSGNVAHTPGEDFANQLAGGGADDQVIVADGETMDGGGQALAGQMPNFNHSLGQPLADETASPGDHNGQSLGDGLSDLAQGGGQTQAGGRGGQTQGGAHGGQTLEGGRGRRQKAGVDQQVPPVYGISTRLRNNDTGDLN